MAETSMKTISQLWNEYVFLTDEMAKILARQDIELFNELLNQRERLQVAIDQVADHEFHKSAAGRSILNEIAGKDCAISNQLRQLFNQTQRRQSIAQSYDHFSTSAQIRFMDRKG